MNTFGVFHPPYFPIEGEHLISYQNHCPHSLYFETIDLGETISATMSEILKLCAILFNTGFMS